MNKKRLLITGGNGLVGNAIRTLESNYPEFECYFSSRQRSFDDLRDFNEVIALFNDVKPQYVLHLAARCGGIGRNLNSPVQQYDDNILMNTNVIKNAYEHNVEKLIAFGSVCSFPSSIEILTENNLHDGSPFPAHYAYAMAKRMVDVQIQAYRTQYKANYCSIIPSNIYGIADNYNLEDGHVIPSLINKCFIAKKENKPFEVWGDGSSFREFIYSIDLAKVCLEMFKQEHLPQNMIVPGVEFQIKNVVEEIAKVYDYKNIYYDTSKPNGQHRRITKSTEFNKYFPNFTYTSLSSGLKTSIEWFIENYEKARK